MKKIKDKKRKYKELIVLCSCALIMFAIGVGLLFGLYRPFVNWDKKECSFEDGTLEYIGNNTGTDYLYRYEVDGVMYEKEMYFIGHGNNGDNSWKYIFVNLKNPVDVKRGLFGDGWFLGFIIVFIVVGIGIACFAFINFYRDKRRLNLKKEEKD